MKEISLPSPNHHPSATSSTIITLKPTAKNTVPTLECCPCDIFGISSSTTTYSIAPAAKLSRYEEKQSVFDGERPVVRIAVVCGFNRKFYKQCNSQQLVCDMQTSVYKGYKQDKIEMRGDRAEMSDFPLYLNTVAGGLDRRDQTIGGFSFVVKIYAVPVVEIIG